MLVNILDVTVENAEDYTGKNGWGAKVAISQLIDKKRETNNLTTKNESVFRSANELLQQKVNIVVNWTQNNFGDRMGEIISLSPVEYKK